MVSVKIELLVVHARVFSSVQVFGHQQSIWSIGCGVLDKYILQSSVLRVGEGGEEEEEGGERGSDGTRKTKM